MASLMQIEQAIIDRVVEAVPQRRVVGRLGNVRETQAAETVVAPEVQVLLSQWEPRAGAPGAGAWRWQVRIVEGAAPSPDRRRLGRPDSPLPEGLFRTLSAIRNALAGVVLAPGHAPLVPAGGVLRTAAYPLMVWEEEYLEAPPVPGLAVPALGTGLVHGTTLAESLGPGASVLPVPTFNVPVAVGLHVVFESADRAFSEYAGTITAINGTEAALERPLSLPFAAGARVWVVADGFGLGTLAGDGSTRSLDDGAATELDLAGGAHRTVMQTPSMLRRDRHGPMPIRDASALLDALRERRFATRLLLLDADGTPHSAAPAGPPRLTLVGNGMAEVELSFRTQPLTSLAGFEVPDA